MIAFEGNSRPEDALNNLRLQGNITTLKKELYFKHLEALIYTKYLKDLNKFGHTGHIMHVMFHSEGNIVQLFKFISEPKEKHTKCNYNK